MKLNHPPRYEIPPDRCSIVGCTEVVRRGVLICIWHANMLRGPKPTTDADVTTPSC